MSNRDSHEDRLPLIHQLAILVFSGFYFIHWFGESRSASSWFAQLGVFFLFLILYFTAFNVRRLTIPCALAMVVLAFVVAPLNHGANTFAIYACSFFAYYQPPRRALVLTALTLISLLIATIVHQLHMLYYFGISAVMVFGLSFSGIVDRQRLEHSKREKSSQAEIRRLAQIAERERIGQDLHDVIGHSLTGIHLKAQLAVKQLEQGNQQGAHEQCDAVAQLAHLALKEIRATLANIKRQSLAEELYAQQAFLQSLGLRFDCRMPDEPIPAAVETDLLLIVRELITNALRHAEATCITLQITSSQQTIQLLYGDNGKGMTHPEEEHLGMGLQGIRRRAGERGGALSISSNGQGLQITITLSARPSFDKSIYR